LFSSSDRIQRGDDERGAGVPPPPRLPQAGQEDQSPAEERLSRLCLHRGQGREVQVPINRDAATLLAVQRFKTIILSADASLNSRKATALK
jgi:hypothetical protein